MGHILVIEDDERTAAEIIDALTEAGWSAVHCDDGESGLCLALQGRFDAITLDRLLPGCDGIEVLARLRTGANKTPVLMVSALGEIDDRVRGLRAGGDDYLVKPFAMIELIARVEALTRRRADPAAVQMKVGSLTIDLLNRQAFRGNRPLDVTQREYRLLEYFARHAGQLLTRSMLYEAVWDYKFDPGTNLIDVHIGRLRRKIDGQGEAPLIVTVRGGGWMFDASA